MVKIHSSSFPRHSVKLSGANKQLGRASIKIETTTCPFIQIFQIEWLLHLYVSHIYVHIVDFVHTPNI